MLTQVFKHEWKILSADRTLWATTVLLLVTFAYGFHNGSSWVEFQRSTLRSIQEEEQQRLAQMKIGIENANAGRNRPSSFSDPRNASAASRTLGLKYASMPPGPLAALAVGQSDLYPYYFKVSIASKDTFLNNDEIENPVHLISGRFDVAFVILYLYPLVILALSYNLISWEKESGTLALTLAQPVSLEAVVLGKIVFRFLFVAAIGIVLSIGGLIATGGLGQPGDVPLRLVLWCGVVALYGAFWFGVAMLVNACGANSSTNAIALSGIWLALVLLIPSLLNVGVKALYPVPSRVEMVQAMRTASAEASGKGSQLLARYYEDHPDLAGERTDTNDFAALSLATQDEIERRAQPVMDRFDEQLALQQALVDHYRFLSPAIIAQSSLLEIAGTGTERYKHFLGLSDRFHRAWRSYFYPKIAKNQAIAASDVDGFPDFHFEEEPSSVVAARAGAALIGLGVPALLVCGLGVFLLRRFPIVG